MSEPYNPRREVFDSEKMLEMSDGWLELDELLKKMTGGQGFSYRPKDEDLKNFWLLWRSIDGRRLIEWWLDMTLRAPYPPVGNDFQEAALAAARFGARAALGEVMLEALAEGKRLYENKNQGNME